MQIYILTCVDECSELLFAKAYKTLEETQTVMRSRLTDHAEDLKRCDRFEYLNIDEMGGATGNADWSFEYKITPDNI